MEKVLCYFALGTAAIVLLLCLVDIVAGFPFGSGPFIVFDIFGILIAAMVGYLGFNALREVK